MAEHDPNDELSVEELEGVAGGNTLGSFPTDDGVDVNCGTNCNCGRD